MTCPCENKCSGKNPPTVLSIEQPCEPVLFHRVDYPASLGDDTTVDVNELDYRNVLLVFANDHVYIYSSDGIPTQLVGDAQDVSALKAQIEALGGQLVEETTAREDADTTLGNQIATLQNDLGQAVSELQADVANEALERDEADQKLQNQISDLNESVETQLDSLDASITALEDATVQKDTSVSANDSTVTITKTTGELTAAGTETDLPLPVASETSAGVMNASTYQAVQENSENIDSILNGAVLIDDLPATPTQDELTLQWKAATGKTTLINRASIYDKVNGKIWYYYTNVSEWESADIQNPEINVSVATNDTPGIVKGSTEDGQVAVEADGSMSLNGYDTLTSDVSNLQNGMPKLPTSMVYDFVSPAGANNPSTADNANITARVVNTGTGTVTNATLMMPMASSTQAGSVTAAEKTKLDNLLPINSLGDGLELSEDGVLSATGGGSDVNLLTVCKASPAEEDVYAASYVNLLGHFGQNTNGLPSLYNYLTVPNRAGKSATDIQLWGTSQNAIMLGGLDNTGSLGSRSVIIGYNSSAPKTYSVALGAFAYTTRSNEVSIGGQHKYATPIPTTRYLANVTAGELPTDAVNLQQMQDAITAAVGNIDTALETLISGTGAN